MGIATVANSNTRPAPKVKFNWVWKNPMELILVLMLLISALSLIYVKDCNRQLFIQCQNMEKQFNLKAQEYQQLLLEKSTLSTHHRIQALASKKLKMIAPGNQDTMVINTKEKRYQILHALKYSNEKPA
jgi:cell division protein FtsL